MERWRWRETAGEKNHETKTEAPKRDKEKPRINDQKPQNKSKTIDRDSREKERNQGGRRQIRSPKEIAEPEQSQSKERHMKTGEGIEEQN